MIGKPNKRVEPAERLAESKENLVVNISSLEVMNLMLKDKLQLLMGKFSVCSDSDDFEFIVSYAKTNE